MIINNSSFAIPTAKPPSQQPSQQPSRPKQTNYQPTIVSAVVLTLYLGYGRVQNKALQCTEDGVRRMYSSVVWVSLPLKPRDLI